MLKFSPGSVESYVGYHEWVVNGCARIYALVSKPGASDSGTCFLCVRENLGWKPDVIAAMTGGWQYCGSSRKHYQSSGTECIYSTLQPHDKLPCWFQSCAGTLRRIHDHGMLVYTITRGSAYQPW